LKKNAQPAPTGNSSASPGPWLTEIIVNGQNANARYASAQVILDAYRLVPRYKILSYPMGPHNRPDATHTRAEAPAKTFIVDEVPSLETRSLCFGVSERESEDDAPAFKMIEQPGVLSGRPLRMHRNKGIVDIPGGGRAQLLRFDRQLQEHHRCVK
jgi:hypothetical protein